MKRIPLIHNCGVIPIDEYQQDKGKFLPVPSPVLSLSPLPLDSLVLFKVQCIVYCMSKKHF